MTGLVIPHMLLALIVIIVVYLLGPMKDKKWLAQAAVAGLITSTLFWIPVSLIVTKNAETEWSVVEEKPLKVKEKTQHGIVYDLDDGAKESRNYVYYHTSHTNEGKVVISKLIFKDAFIERWFDPRINLKYDIYLPKE